MEEKKLICNEKESLEKRPLKEWHAPKLYDLETAETKFSGGGQDDGNSFS